MPLLQKGGTRPRARLLLALVATLPASRDLAVASILPNTTEPVLDLSAGLSLAGDVPEGGCAYFSVEVRWPDVSTVTFTVDVQSGVADVLVRGGGELPALDNHALAVSGVAARGSITLAPASDTPPCSFESCVVVAAVRGVSALTPANATNTSTIAFNISATVAVSKLGLYVDGPPSVAGAYAFSHARYGPALPFEPLAGPLVRAEPYALCTPPTVDLNGAIALVGGNLGCDSSSDKVRRALLASPNLLAVIIAVTVFETPGQNETIVPQLTTTDTPEFVQGINVPVISISRTAAAALSDALAASAAGVNLTLVHPAGAPRLLWGGEMGGAGSATVDLRTFGTRYFELRPTGEERELRFEVRPPLGAAPAELTVFAAAFGAGVPPSSSTAPTADAHALGGVQTAGGTRLLLLRALEPLEASALCAGCTVLVGVYTEEALAAVQVRALASHAFTLAADEPRADATGGAGADSLGGARYFRVEVDVASGPMRLELELNSTDGQLLELFAALDSEYPTYAHAPWVASTAEAPADATGTRRAVLTVDLSFEPAPRTPVWVHAGVGGAAAANFTLLARASAIAAPPSPPPPVASPEASSSPSASAPASPRRSSGCSAADDFAPVRREGEVESGVVRVLRMPLVSRSVTHDLLAVLALMLALLLLACQPTRRVEAALALGALAVAALVTGVIHRWFALQGSRTLIAVAAAMDLGVICVVILLLIVLIVLVIARQLRRQGYFDRRRRDELLAENPPPNDGAGGGRRARAFSPPSLRELARRSRLRGGARGPGSPAPPPTRTATDGAALPALRSACRRGSPGEAMAADESSEPAQAAGVPRHVRWGDGDADSEDDATVFSDDGSFGGSERPASANASRAAGRNDDIAGDDRYRV